VKRNGNGVQTNLADGGPVFEGKKTVADARQRRGKIEIWGKHETNPKVSSTQHSKQADPKMKHGRFYLGKSETGRKSRILEKREKRRRVAKNRLTCGVQRLFDDNCRRETRPEAS